MGWLCKKWVCLMLAASLSFLGSSKAMEATSSAYYNPANPHNVYMPMVSTVPVVCVCLLFHCLERQKFAFLVKLRAP